jgi:hypothetical protein
LFKNQPSVVEPAGMCSCIGLLFTIVHPVFISGGAVVGRRANQANKHGIDSCVAFPACSSRTWGEIWPSIKRTSYRAAAPCVIFSENCPKKMKVTRESQESQSQQSQVSRKNASGQKGGKWHTVRCRKEAGPGAANAKIYGIRQGRPSQIYL